MADHQRCTDDAIIDHEDGMAYPRRTVSSIKSFLWRASTFIFKYRREAKFTISAHLRMHGLQSFAVERDFAGSLLDTQTHRKAIRAYIKRTLSMIKHC